MKKKTFISYRALLKKQNNSFFSFFDVKYFVEFILKKQVAVFVFYWQSTCIISGKITVFIFSLLFLSEKCKYMFAQTTTWVWINRLHWPITRYHAESASFSLWSLISFRERNLFAHHFTHRISGYTLFRVHWST